MQEFQEDFYAILGVQEGAAAEEIRKAYLKLAKKLHPDRFPNDPEKRSEAQAEFSRVTRAHEVLGDPKQKEEYDALRMIARNRAALDIGAPGGATAAAGSPAASQAMEAKVESKESWAQKHYARAQDCYKKKKYQEAETAIKEAIRLIPNKTLYHCQLAEIYLARGWKTLAQTEIQTALRIDPKDDDAKQIEMRLKVAAKESDKQKKDDVKKPGSIIDQIKQMLTKKM